MTDMAAPRRGVPVWRIAAAMLAAMVLAGSWMLFSLAAGKAGLGKALSTQSSDQAALTQAVTRTGITRRGTKVQVLLAAPEYYERIGQTAAADEADPVKHLVFIVTEENHDALSPAPLPTLMADGKRVAAPAKDRFLSASDHHRTRMIRFVRTAPDGAPYLPKDARRLELAWPGLEAVHRPDHTVGNPLSWEWPLRLPSESSLAGLTPLTFLLLTAGLFAALSPCLIQLTLYYISALAASTAENGGDRRRLLKVAVMFVAGVSLAYTLGGVLAGYVGRAIQVSTVLGSYGRWIAIASGLVIVAMGLRAVLASGAPLVCQLTPRAATRFGAARSGPLAPFLMGFLISIGCLQCFGGAIFASLLLYVGSLGSPGLGALMLFLFSLGVGLPFLLAAVAWQRITHVAHGLGRVMPYVSLGGGVVMMAFGLLMIIDRFHWISGMLLQWMEFLQA